MDEERRRMRDDERVEELERGAPVFAVAPVRQRTRVPRAALVGITVGIVAFVAGIGVASAGPSRTATPSFALATERPASGEAGEAGEAATLAPASPAAPADPLDPGFGAPVVAPEDAAASRLPAPGSSGFVAGFDPAALIAGVDGAERCETGEPRDKEVPRTRRDGPRMTFQRSWIAWCPVPAADRQAFLLGLFRSLVEAVPAETFGFSATLAGSGDALFPYGEQPLAGTVAITADDAGRGVAIAIVVSEWRVDARP